VPELWTLGSITRRMKICSYCGREYPDDAVVCTTDQTSLDTPEVVKRPVRFRESFRGIQPVRVTLWAALQLIFLVLVFPDFASYANEEQHLRACFVAAAFALVSIVIVVPMFPKASPVAGVMLALMILFPALILVSVLMEL
jgi:hypothetical protein